MSSLATYTYGELLRAARDASAYFDQTRIPGGPAARMASTVLRDLSAKFTMRSPEGLESSVDIPVATIVAALGPPPAPVTLPNADLYIRAVVSRPNDPTEGDILPMTNPWGRLTFAGPAWYPLGRNAYFTGVASDWATVDHVTIEYAPYPGDLDSEDTVVALPDTAKDAFTAKLAYAFALRINRQPLSLEQPDPRQLIQLDVNAFQDTAQRAEWSWLVQLTNQRNKVRSSIPNGVEFT
jgi:hypothetical protein